MDVQGKRVLVVGLARSGRAAVDCLRRRGAVVTVTDSRPPWDFPSDTRELLSLGVGVEFGGHREETFLKQDLIVASPGVPWNLPILAAARERRIPVVPEVEVAGWYLQGTLVGVTGSNGKTTTTSLLGRMLEASGFPVFVGGNIGVPLVSAVDSTGPDSRVVAEFSSFQLEAIETLHPQVAVLLNITPNHLDRHPSFEAYAQAKARIFRNQTADDCAVLNADDATVMDIARGIRAQRILFSLTQNLASGLLVSGDAILYRVHHLERKLFSTSDVKLRGTFNIENVLAAAAAACALGADFDAMARAVREFHGVEHRLEFVRRIRGIEFFNDSKATSVDATVKALSAFERGVHVILGGKDKGAPYAPLIAWLQGRVREALLIGAAAERIERELSGAVPMVRCGELAAAVEQAFINAVPGDVILLAPACASFDQFQDFEQRGRVFKQLVEQLEQKPKRERRPFEQREASPEVAAPPPAEAAESAGNEATPALRVLDRSELVYVYEQEAEERTPLEVDFDDVAEHSSVPGGPLASTRVEAPEAIESLESEPLMYECVAASEEARAPEAARKTRARARNTGQAKLF